MPDACYDRGAQLFSRDFPNLGAKDLSQINTNLEENKAAIIIIHTPDE